MLLSITNIASPATDIGFLLHKNPANLHSADLSFGRAHVFYSDAAPERCTAHLLVEVDPVQLVRGAGHIDQYVNDRPYVASSHLTVAMGRVFGTALAARCDRRPELVEQRLPLEIVVEVVRAQGGEGVLRRLFEPLGYTVSLTPIPLDGQLPGMRESLYFRLVLQAEVTVHDALSHLYVLLPVLDAAKHYYIGDAEVDKLFRHGEGWFTQHPERTLIVRRYLKRRSSLIEQAVERLSEAELQTNTEELDAEPAGEEEKRLERPLTLHTQRLIHVAERLKSLGAQSVADLGCGEGKLLRRLMAERSFEKILGIDVSHRSLVLAAGRLHLDRLPERQRQRIELRQGSLLYRDAMLEGFDAAAMVEVIEHLDPARFAAMERVVFEFARPQHVVITTPNREYNALFPTLEPGRLRHPDHRFEWTRSEFSAWASGVASRFGYSVTVEPVGPTHAEHGAPTQMAVFTRVNGASA